ncbi:GHKL domain-containing protein [Arundinibacter roseus]|uniref:histidine kinase n=2 Tax=Arundinibacter roseus TaxID=2070510 RepID=A0A4R4JZF2_9BACT|nr:GHKL domain-containing protein [Arundinibacter roseus]
MIKCAENLKDYKYAFRLQLASQALNDSLDLIENKQMAEELTVKYETEKKDAQLANQEIELLTRRQQLTQTALLGTLSILIIGVAFVFYRWQHSQRIKQIESDFEQTAKQLQSFNYSVSHDLRQPIYGIEYALKQLHRTDPAPNQIHLLAQANKSVNNMKGIIEGLLDLSSIERSRLVLAEVNTELLIKDVLEQMPTHATITIDSLPIVKADVRLLRQVFVNLLSNAIKYSDQQAEPHIQICATQTINKVSFEVSDNGLGFDDQFGDKLFQLFGRLHPQVEGVGIGLLIVKKIVEKHGGKVYASGKPHLGAKFGFDLPT